MPNFKTINHLNEMNLPNKWVDSQKFDSKDRLIELNGHQYRIIAKKEIRLSCLERIGRGLLGMVAVIFSLSLAFFFSQTIRELFTKKREMLRFGLLENKPEVTVEEEVLDPYDKVYEPLADFGEQIGKVRMGNCNLYLDHLIKGVKALPEMVKLADSKDLKYLVLLLEDHFDDLLKEIPGALKRLAAIDSKEASIHLAQITSQGHLAEQLRAVAEEIQETAPEVAAVLIDRSKKLAPLFQSSQPIEQLPHDQTFFDELKTERPAPPEEEPSRKIGLFFLAMFALSGISGFFARSTLTHLTPAETDKVDQEVEILRSMLNNPELLRKEGEILERSVKRIANRSGIEDYSKFLSIVEKFSGENSSDLTNITEEISYFREDLIREIKQLPRSVRFAEKPKEIRRIDSKSPPRISPPIDAVNPIHLVTPAPSALIPMPKMIADGLFYWFGFETAAHRFERLKPIIEQHREQLSLLNTDATALINFAKEAGLETSLKVLHDGNGVIDRENCQKLFSDLEQTIKVHRSQVEQERERLISKAIRKEHLIQLQSFLDATPKKRMDPKLFQHIMLDYSGAGTGFEGYLSLPMLGYKLQLVEHWVKSLENHSLTGDFAPLETFKALRDSVKTAIHFTQKLQGPLDEFHAEMNRKVAEMKKGDSVFLQAGWSIKGIGHAVVLEFIKEEKTFTVRLYNRGQGLERHSVTVDGTKEAALSFIEIEKVEADALTNPVFLGLIAALNRGELIKEESDKILYEKIVPLLGGTPSNREYSAEHLQEVLDVSHCTWLSLTAFDHQFLNNSDQYQRWSLLTKLYALQHMYSTNTQKLIHDKEVRELLRMGSSQVAKDISLMPLELFSNAERIYVSKLQANLRAAIEQADAHHLEKAKAKRPPAQMNLPVQIFGKNSTLDQLGEPKQWGIRSKASIDNPYPLLTQIRNYVPSSKTIAGHLKTMTAAVIPKKRTIDAFAAAHPILSELVRRLPLEKSFWWRISAEDADGLLDSLRTLSHNFISGVMASGMGAKIKQPISSSDMMVLLKIFTLANMANQQLPKEQKVELDHLLPESYRQFLLSEMPNAELIDPLWQKQFTALKEYWITLKEKDYQGPSFFLTEGFVPGVPGKEIEYAKLKIQDSLPWEPEHRNYHERGDKLGVEWLALNWLEDWVDRNREKTAKIEAAESRGKALFLLANVAHTDPSFRSLPTYRTLLPKGFRILYDLSKDLAMLTAGKAVNAEEFLNAEMSLRVAERTNLHPQRYSLRYQTNIKMEVRPPLVATTPDHLSSRLLGKPLNTELDTLYRADIPSFRLGKLRRRMPPTERVLFRKDIANLELANELAHRIEACSSMKELQITETLAFFSDHRHLLDNPDYRSLLAKLLLEPGLLEKRLSAGKAEAAATLQSLSTLFIDHFHLKQSLGQVNAAGDLLELYDQISKIIDQTNQLVPEGFPNARQEWRKLLNGELTEDERSRFAADLALSYIGSDSLDPQAVDDILACMLWFDQNPLPNDHPLWSPAKDLQFRSLAQHYAGLLTQAIPDNDDQIIPRAIKRVIPDFEMRPFSRTDSPHIYTDYYGDVEVNLLTGHVWFKNGSPRILPKILSNHHVLAKLQPPVAALLWHEGIPGQFRTQTADGELTLFANEQHQLEEIHWKTNGSTYRYTEWDKTKNFTGIIRESGLLWTNLEKSNALVTPFDQLKPIYEILAGEQINLLGSNLVMGENLEIFSNLDNPEYIATWIDDISGLPVKVILPRLGLEFNMETVKGQRRAYCPHFPGWYCAKKQFIPALGDLTNYIVLQQDLPDGTIEQEVLIPEQQLMQGKSPLAPALIPNWLPKKLSSTTPVHRYGIEQGELKPRGPAAFRHLAAIYWHQRDYRKAINLIQAYGSELSKLDKQQRELIQHLTMMPGVASDYSPPSLAAALEAHYLLLRDVWDFGSGEEIENEQLLADYLAYLQVIEQTGIYTLAPEKERLIIRHLDKVGLPEKEDPRITQRRNPLKVQKTQSPHSGTVATGLDQSNKFYYESIPNHKQVPLPTKMEGPYLEWVSLEAHFLALYDLVRNPSPENLATLVKYLTGLNLTGEYALNALKAHALYHRDDPHRISLALLSVLRDPKAFPTTETMQASLSKDEVWDKVSAEEKTLFDQYYKRSTSANYSYLRIDQSKLPVKDFSVAPAEKQTIARKQIPRRPLGKDEVSSPARHDVKFQLCSKLKSEVLDLGRSMLTDFSEAISAISMDMQPRQSALEELENLFHVQTNDKVLRDGFASVVAEIGKFRSELQPDKIYTLNSNAEEILTNWSDKLTETATSLEHDLQQAKQNVVDLANKMPSDPVLLALCQQELEGKILEPLDFNTLTSFLPTRDLEQLHHRLPYLTPTEIHQLFDGTIEALKIGRLQNFVVYQQQIVSQLLAAIHRKEPNVEISRIVKLLEKSDRYHPAYFANEHPEYLVYDYFMSKNDPRFRLRGDQVQVLEMMPKREFHAHTDHLTGVLLEAIMGFGKGDVVSVLQAVQEADGDKLVAISMPGALLPSMSARLQKLLGDSFRRMVEPVKFDRDSDVSAAALEHLLDRLKNIREGRRVMLISSNSVLSIALRFVELALQKDGVSDRQIELMSEIVTTLRTSGLANLDEVDLLLDILQAHLFTLGDHKPVHPDMEVAQVSLFEAIVNKPELRNLIRWPFIGSESTIPFSEQNYLRHAKEPLIEMILKDLLPDLKEKKLIADYLRAEPQKPEELLALFRRLDPKERKALATYIVEGTGYYSLPHLSSQEKKVVEEYKAGQNDPAYTYVRNIADPRIRNLLATYKEQVSKLFPIVMTKILGENYGPLPKEWRAGQKGMEFVAIPYHGSGKPAWRSLHGTVSEILDYTMMMHLAQPINPEIVDLEIVRLKAMLDQEIEKGISSADDSDALMGFEKIGGKGKLGGPITEAQKERIAAHINRHPELKIELIQRHVLPQVKRYPKQLGLASQMVAYLFNSVKAYSGTLWNLVTFPKLFHKLIPSDTQARTLDLLWRKSPHKIEIIPEWVSTAPLNEQVAYLYKEEKSSLIDLQGTFRNRPNIEVAHAIINLPQFKNSRYEAILFHNERGQEMVLRRGELRAVPLATESIHRDNVLAYFAQKYCTGVDWKLHPLEEAKVTVGRQTLMRDALQAVWRLRELAEGQNVRLIVPEEDFRIIAGELKRVFDIDVGAELQLEHFFIYAIYLEKERLRSDTPRALKEALKAHLIDKIFGAIKGAKAKDLRSLFQLTAELFVTSEPDSPWEQMGENPTEAPKEIFVAKNLQYLFKSKAFQAFFTHPLLKKYSPDQIKQQLREIADSYVDQLSDTLTIASNDNSRNEVEIEMQKELKVETEVKKETKKQMHIEIQSPKYTVPRPVRRFKWGSLLQSKTWKTVHPDNISSSKNQVIQVNDLLKTPIFAEELSIDLNLAPIYNRTVETQPPYEPWNGYQDIVTNAVIIDGTRLAMVSQDTADQILEELKYAQPGDVRIALYNLDSGLVIQGPEPVDIPLQLIVQAKFFDGRTRYTPQEKTILKDWLRSTNRVKEMRELFTQRILVNRDDATERFSGSTIDKVFNSILSNL